MNFGKNSRRSFQEKEKIRKNKQKNLAIQNKSSTFAAAFIKKLKVPWMSGLVNGLQNRLQQ
ncbi:MAG: hypothetical protein J1E77_06580, partial [Prevotella sp.]|nr:hypothetical protein [Prevotella sp.]